MPTAKKLPSGSWRCLVYSHTEASGKRVYKSFCCPDPSPRGKRTCEAMAAEWAREKELSISTSKSFRAALDAYIDAREHTLSPRTVEEYKRIGRLYLQPLSGKKIDTITQSDIQKTIDECAARLAPKTVYNIHGLISAVMLQERPQMALRTTLPQKVKPNLSIPSDHDVRTILDAVRGTVLELPVMLAAFGPMREGEICALRSENIQGNTVHVCENMIKQTVDGHYTWIIRHPKTTESDRFIDYPDFVSAHWRGLTGRLVDLNPLALCKRFKRLVRKLGLPDIRFHDLRHWCASTLHAQGVPDAYIMQRGGWSSDAVLKSVYRHTLSDYQKSMTQLANNHFAAVMQHEMQHEKEKAL